MRKESDMEKMERLKDRIEIHCNQCYRQLTQKERNHYSIQHQWLGKVYCDEHREEGK